MGKIKVIIRDAEKEELEVIRALRLNAYEEHVHKMPEKHWEMLRNSIVSDNDDTIGLERIVAEVDGELLGTVVLYPAKANAYEGMEVVAQDYPELRMLAISSQARGKGIAKALVQECMKRAKQQGFRALGLHTADFMVEAMTLYRRLGFQHVPELDFEPGHDGIIVRAFKIEL